MECVIIDEYQYDKTEPSATVVGTINEDGTFTVNICDAYDPTVAYGVYKPPVSGLAAKPYNFLGGGENWTTETSHTYSSFNENIFVMIQDEEGNIATDKPKIINPTSISTGNQIPSASGFDVAEYDGGFVTIDLMIYL